MLPKIWIPDISSVAGFGNPPSSEVNESFATAFSKVRSFCSREEQKKQWFTEPARSAPTTRNSLSCSHPILSFIAVLAEIKSGSVAVISETCSNSHLSADVSKLCALVSGSFPQIIKQAHTERFPSVSPQCHLGFVYLCVKWGILCGLLVGSLVKEVSFASCDGGTRDHDPDFFVLIWFVCVVVLFFFLIWFYFPPEFPLPVTEGALPPEEAKT